jgi:hypothetical protein
MPSCSGHALPFPLCGMSRVIRGLLPGLEEWQDIFWIAHEPCGATRVKVVQPVSMDTTAQTIITAFNACISFLLFMGLASTILFRGGRNEMTI